MFNPFHKHKVVKVYIVNEHKTFTKCEKCGKHLARPIRTEDNGSQDNRKP